MLLRSIIFVLLTVIANAGLAMCPQGYAGQDSFCVVIVEMIANGEKVNLKGFAGGVVHNRPVDSSEYLAWYSSIDGKLGMGRDVYAILSPGMHTITAFYSYPGGSYSDEKTLRVRKKFCENETLSLAYTTNVWYTSTFENRTDEHSRLYWIDYTTHARWPYGVMEPGKRLSVNGYPGNRWVVTDANDNCLGVFETQYKNTLEYIDSND